MQTSVLPCKADELVAILLVDMVVTCYHVKNEPRNGERYRVWPACLQVYSSELGHC